MVFYISVHHTEILLTSSLTAKCKTSAFRDHNLGKTKVVLIFCWDQPFQPEPIFVGVVEVPPKKMKRNTFSTVLGLKTSRICGI